MKLMLKMGSMIPQMKSYTDRMAKEAALLKKAQEQSEKKATKGKNKK